MHELVPLSRILIQRCGIPEILVKLSIREARQLCPKVSRKVKCNQEAERIAKHNRSYEIAEALHCGSFSNHFHDGH